jgi:hypothetical protein
MIARRNEAEPLIAYVYGEHSPDFQAIAAMGFEVVCLDTRAAWYTVTLLEEAKRHGLLAVAHPMSFDTATISSRFNTREPVWKSLSRGAQRRGK